MSFRAIISDLDGTLIRWNGELSPMSKDVFKRLVERNITIIIATARPPRYAVDFIEGIPEDSWYICYNGAEIFHHGQCVYKKCVKARTTSKLIAKMLSMDEDFHIAIESDNRIYTDRDLGGMFGQAVPYEEVNWVTMGEMDAAKILVAHGDEGVLQRLAKTLSDEVRGMITDGGSLLHITDRDIDKSVAAKWVLGKLGFDLSQAIAFGDDTNDRLMLKRAGLGVAIDSAPEDVIKAANMTCPQPEYNGVAKVIKERILGDNNDA